MTRYTLIVLASSIALAAGTLAGCTPTGSADAAPARPVATAAAASSVNGPTAPQGSAAVYAKPPAAELRAKLTPLEYDVTQNAATEPPFHNTYWDNHEPGLYVDVVTGEPLFSSQDKFESGTGWPSFTRPLEDGHVIEHSDRTMFMERTEVVSKVGASHLGHVFDDGPQPTGQRFCINSASLRFIPASHLAAEGYGAYAPRFGVAVAASSASPGAPSK